MGFDLFKLGHDDENHEMVEHLHGNTFQHQDAGRSRLLIAPANRHVDTMLWLLREMRGPFFILIVLKVTFSDEFAWGRYASDQLMGHEDAESFLIRFRDFLERDGRHEVWVSSEKCEEMLVYDEHNYIYAYGPIEAFQSVLRKLDFIEGESPLTNPHSHHYHREFEEDFQKMMSEYGWVYTPLREQDQD